jgi:hypothetical protein
MISFQRVVSLIEGYCKAKKTGTLVVASANGPFSQLVLDKGVIVNLACGNKMGMEALEQLRVVEEADCTFKQGDMELPANPTMPVTESILAKLRSPGNSKTAKQVPKNSTKPGAVVPTGDSLFAGLKSQLGAVLGPVGAIIISQFKNQIMAVTNSDDLKAVLQAVDTKIDDPAVVQQFEANVRGWLDSLTAITS